MENPDPVQAQLSRTNQTYHLDVEGLVSDMVAGYDYRLQEQDDGYIVEFVIETHNNDMIYTAVTVSESMYYDFQDGVESLQF